MDIRKLQRAIVDGLEDVKAQNIVVFNTEHLSPLFERVIIASGTSNRQTKALASSVRDSVKKRGMQVMRTEGEDNGEWIIVDCGAAVAHIMQPAIREYYHLEEIWGGKPVKLKLDGEVKGLVKASSPDDEDDEPAPAAKKVAAKKSATAKTAAGKVATMTIVDVDNAEQRIVITSPMGSAALKGCHEVQNIGAVETYQRRYLWVAALEIVEHDALDATTGKEKPEAKKKNGVMADLLKELPPLDEGSKAYYEELSEAIHGAFDTAGAHEAFQIMYDEHLDNDQKIYLSSYLRSDVRAALKKEGEKRRKEKADAGA